MTGNPPTVPNIQVTTVRSSAGSGKTYRLAEHYLKVLLSGALADTELQTRVSNIVAITFTNKASQEMRARILDWMKRIILDLPFKGTSTLPLDTIMKGITTVAAYTGTTSSGTAEGSGIAEKAVKLRKYLMEAMNRRFVELLKDFGRFNVGTIDSFVNLTLKASALQLDLPPDFDVSTETKELIDIAIGECLQRSGEDDRVREMFDRFLYNYIEMEGDRTNWVPKDLLRETISAFWKEESKENRDFFIPEDNVSSSTGSVRKKIADNARALIDSLTANRNIQPSANAMKAIEKCADPYGDALSQSVYFERTLRECMKKNSAGPSFSDEKVWEALKGLRRVYAEALSISKFLSYLEIYFLFKEVFQRETTYFRRVIPIEQLNRLLQDILHRRDFVPEIYYTLAERYNHFLVDEFQDTSLLQWKNIEVLAEEALGRGGTLFLVGDRKQAIYRWRGGRADLVDNISHRYECYPCEEPVLDTNYRSGEYIVSFNNEAFDAGNLSGLAGSILREHPPESQASVVTVYKDSRQNFLETKKGCGYVSIEKTAVDQDEEDLQDVFTGEEAGGIIEEKLQNLVGSIMERGVFREKDIAVLVRTREEAKTVVRTLLSMNLNVESEYTVSIRNNPLIGEVMSFLKFIDKPDDDLSLASFITGRIFSGATGIGIPEMTGWLSLKYLFKRPESLHHAFKSDFSRIFEDHFAGFLKKTGYLPLYDLSVSFFKQWGVLSRFPDDTPYLLHFLELIRQSEGEEGSNITDFIAFMEGNSKGLPYGVQDEDRVFLLPTSDSINAIKVLTIHKAKGLQFPVVILPFVTLTTFSASFGRDKQRCFQSTEDGLRLLYLKKEHIAASPGLMELYRTKEREYLSDELNNLYVAFTRAEEELYIFLTDRKNRKNHLIDYLFEMEGFRPYRQGNSINMGQARLPQARDNTASSASTPEEDTGVCLPVFADFTGETGWIEKIRPGISDTGRLTKHGVAARKKGDAIHRALSLIGKFPVDDATIASVARAAASQEHIDDVLEEVRRSLEIFFANPDFRCFFDIEKGSSFFNEKEIVEEKGNTFKIDRLVVRQDIVEVIDYKTGETVSGSHVEQIRHYGKLAAEIYPDKKIRKFLLYIDEGKVIEV